MIIEPLLSSHEYANIESVYHYSKKINLVTLTLLREEVSSPEVFDE